MAAFAPRALTAAQKAHNARVRAAALRARRALSEEEIRARSQKVRAQIARLLRDRGARTVAAYWPTGGEVDVLPLAQALLDAGRTVLFPRVDAAGKMDFCAVKDLRFASERFRSIRQPAAGLDAFAPERIDAAIVPVVAFTRKRLRLGHGTGCYDAFFSGADPDGAIYRVGAAYAFQEADLVYARQGDAAMDAVATEGETI